MAYIVDHTGDWAFVEGVGAATYTDPDSNVDTQVKVRKGSLSMSDYRAGETFGVVMGDVPFTVWNATLSTATLKPQGTLVFEGTTYTVIGVLSATPDGAQTRILCREQVS